MTKPVMFSSHNSVFFELSRGKIGKDGSITIQKGQKGNTCFFYAMKRLLRTEEIRSSHGKLCSQYRKIITLDDSKEDCHRAASNANEFFLTQMNLNTKETAVGFLREKLMKRQSKSMPEELLSSEKMLETMEEIKREDNPLIEFQLVCCAVNHLMASHHGLQEVFFKDIKTAVQLIQKLKRTGPLMVSGSFGSARYVDNPIKLEATLGSHELYGWRKGAQTISEPEDVNNSHAIVIVGAEIKGDKQYVYWIDPKHANDPNDPNSQRLHMSSFEVISSSMDEVSGIDITQFEKDNLAVAFYNPAFAPT
jgi:hypothetical protein